jgi:ABC-type sugar transport system ATPase subunit
MKEIFEICDDVTVMRNGEVSFDGPLTGLSLDDIVYHMTGQRPDTKQAAPAAGEMGGAPSEGSGAERVLHVENLRIEPRVKNISMAARKGQIIGIGGLEGQGQPEFMRAVLGAMKPDGGTLYYKERAAEFHSAYDGVKSNIGFVSGERGNEAIFAMRTVAENICAALFVKGPLFRLLWPRTVRGHASKAVEDYKIVVGSLKHPASSLSGGNQQKLVVARWLSMKPDLLLLDDPTKGVDIHSRSDIHKLLRVVADNGMTVIISSSENEELLDVADCIYVFFEGVVAAELKGADKTAERLVAAMMGMTASQEGRGNDGHDAGAGGGAAMMGMTASQEVARQ